MSAAIKRLKGAGALGLVLCGCATASTRPAPASGGSCDQLNGAWEGSLPIGGSGTGGSALDELKVRLIFTAGSPKVQHMERGKWAETMPGSFQARCRGPSAVVHAIDSARDNDGTWFESWVLTVTMREKDALLVKWVRMVNNVDVPLSKSSSKFTAEAAGVLQRIQVPPANAACSVQTAESVDKMTVGEFLERACDCGNAGSCDALAVSLERDGGSANLAHARELRRKACALGHQPSCAAVK